MPTHGTRELVNDVNDKMGNTVVSKRKVLRSNNMS